MVSSHSLASMASKTQGSIMIILDTSHSRMSPTMHFPPQLAPQTCPETLLPKLLVPTTLLPNPLHLSLILEHLGMIFIMATPQISLPPVPKTAFPRTQKCMPMPLILMPHPLRRIPMPQILMPRPLPTWMLKQVRRSSFQSASLG